MSIPSLNITYHKVINECFISVDRIVVIDFTYLLKLHGGLLL